MKKQVLHREEEYPTMASQRKSTPGRLIEEIMHGKRREEGTENVTDGRTEGIEVPMTYRSVSPDINRMNPADTPGRNREINYMKPERWLRFCRQQISKNAQQKHS